MFGGTYIYEALTTIKCQVNTRQVYCLFVCVCVFFAISWAAPMAYGGSHARGLIGAVAAGLHHIHSNVGSKLRL